MSENKKHFYTNRLDIKYNKNSIKIYNRETEQEIEFPFREFWAIVLHLVQKGIGND